MRSARFALFFLMIGLMWGACDSASTVEDPGKTHFVRFYGGDGSQTGEDFVVMPDNSMILFGTTTPSAAGSTSRWYLVKVDPNGQILWEKTFAGGAGAEEARDIELTNYGTIVLLGNTYKTPTDRDVFVMTLSTDGVKIDSAIIPIYDKVTGLPSNGDEDAANISQTTDGFIIAGSTTYVWDKGSQTSIAGSKDPRDALTMRLTPQLQSYGNGWPNTQSYGFFSDDASHKIIQTSTGFYVFGYSNSPNSGQTVENFNYWYFSLDNAGAPGGGNKYVGLQTEDEIMTSFSTVPIASGDGFILSGISKNTASGKSDLSACKLRKTLAFQDADIQFLKTTGTALGTNPSPISSVLASQLGGYYFLGNEQAFNNNQNWVLARLDNGGSTIGGWNPIVFGGEGVDGAGNVMDLPDGRIGIIGTMTTGKSDVGETKMTLIKVNADGQLN